MGDPAEIFSSRDTSGWHAQQGARQWVVIDHTLTSPKSGAISSATGCSRITLHVSSATRRARTTASTCAPYEVQIDDSTGLENATDRLGAIFGFLAPSETSRGNPATGKAFTSFSPAG
jgi:hypothetical protein